MVEYKTLTSYLDLKEGDVLLTIDRHDYRYKPRLAFIDGVAKEGAGYHMVGSSLRDSLKQNDLDKLIICRFNEGELVAVLLGKDVSEESKKFWLEPKGKPDQCPPGCF